MAVKEIMESLKEKGAGFFSIKEKNLFFTLVIVITVLVNIAGLTLNYRIDLTRNNVYSLSKKSKQVVSNLRENLNIKVLFSKDLPAQHGTLYRYLVDLLEEYDYHGNEYFSYEIVDEKSLEKVAADFGIRPVQSQEFADDQVKVRRTYMGLVIQQADIIEKIDSVTSPEGLEYEITSLIEKMSGKISGLLALDKPLQVNLYVHPAVMNLPIEGINTFEKDIKEAVDASNQRNYDKLEFQVINTADNPEAAKRADACGVNRLKWRGGATPAGKAIAPGEGHLGLVLEAEGKCEPVDVGVSPTLFGQNVLTGIDNLEDRINDAVGNLLRAGTKVGYITGHGEADPNDERSREGAALLRNYLSDLYEVTVINLPEEEIPGDIETVIINGPRKEFTEYELFQIDQFLMKGKSAIFFIDSFVEFRMPGGGMFGSQPQVIPVNTGLDDILKFYGATVNKNIVLDANCARVNLGNAIKDYPLVPLITNRGLSDESVITKYLRGVAFIKASSVDLDTENLKKEKLRYLNLVESSEESWLMEGRINFNPFLMDAEGQPKESMRSYPLAVIVSGGFTSYFAGKNAPLPEGKKETTGTVTGVTKRDSTIEKGKSSIIVVGTSEITRSGFLVDSQGLMSRERQDEGGSFSNGIFLHNMVDYLAGNTYVPEMRSKSLDYNPLRKTGDGTRLALKAINIAGVPLLVLLAGFVVWRKRISRKNRIKTMFSGAAEK